MFLKLLPSYYLTQAFMGLGLVMSVACSESKQEGQIKQPPLNNQLSKTTYVPDPDTLRVEDEFARSPFLLDSVSLAGVRHLMGANVQIKKTPTRNHFVANQTDTLITLRKKGSYITLYAVSAEPKCFFKEAAIKDPLPIFQNHLSIGQHKAEVKKLFPVLKSKSYLPDNIEIAAADGADYVYLIFKNDILHRIDFKPYLD